MIVIEQVSEQHLKDIHHLHRHYIKGSSFSAERHVPSIIHFGAFARNVSADFPFLICRHDKELVGYAYGNKYRTTSGNAWSAETSIYLWEKYHGFGLAHQLYRVLLTLLEMQGYMNAFASIVLPNSASLGLHRKCGFFEVGCFKQSIHKFGKWHDMLWMQRHLAKPIGRPTLPTSFSKLGIEVNQFLKDMVSSTV